jgi:hypothetical protein
LLDQASRVIDEIKVVVNKLNSVDFAEREVILQEERDRIVEKYNYLIDDLQKQKEDITRQIEKDMVVVTPLQQKVIKEGYCYFCNIKITSGIPYQFSKEEQKVLEVEIVEGAGFCSQECLLGHCKEYKKWVKLRQEEEEKIEEKIESNKRLVARIHLAIGNLRSKVNRLAKKEKELALGIDTFPSEKKVGFFRQIAQNLGLAKKESSPNDKLVEYKRQRKILEMSIRDKEKYLQQSLLALKIDEQFKKVREASKRIHSKRNAINKKVKEDTSIDE